MPRGGTEFDLRWFTPRIEVALCGHATLAGAHVLWESGRAHKEEITFVTRKSGILSAVPQPMGEIALEFPAKPATPCPEPPGLLDALGASAIAIARNEFDYLVEVTSERELRALQPNFAKLLATESRGVIATAMAESTDFDFVSRFFAPKVGIDEDPVTGSAHCCLSEYWGEKLGKIELVGYQASERGGVVRVTRNGDRVKLVGRATSVWRGELLIPCEPAMG